MQQAMSIVQAAEQAPFLASVQARARVALLAHTRVPADKEHASTAPLVSMLLLQAPLRARVARLASLRHRPEAEAARRVRQVGSRMSPHKDSVTHVSTARSQAAQEALCAGFVPLANSPRLVLQFARHVLQVDTETRPEDPLAPSAKLVSLLLA